MEPTVLNHALARHYLGALRNRHSSLQEFRAASHRLSLLLVAEATRNLPTAAAAVDSQLEQVTVDQLTAQVVAVPVLRAGLGLLRAAEDLLPDLLVGFIGLERDDSTAIARSYYTRLPEMAGTHVLLLDPMLATGGSACDALNLLKPLAPAAITLICVVAAPQGIQRLRREHADVQLITAVVDRDLNALSYILPGLGDYGDRLHGT